MWDDAIPWYAFSSFLGVAVAFGTFWINMEPPPIDTWELAGLHSRVSGPVIAMDPGHSVTIAAASNFSKNEPPVPMRFLFDDRTLWSSIEFVFEGETAIDQKTGREKSRELPKGTFISVRYNPARSGNLYAYGIAFIRRTEL